MLQVREIAQIWIFAFHLLQDPVQRLAHEILKLNSTPKGCFVALVELLVLWPAILAVVLGIYLAAVGPVLEYGLKLRLKNQQLGRHDPKVVWTIVEMNAMLWNAWH